MNGGSRKFLVVLPNVLSIYRIFLAVIMPFIWGKDRFEIIILLLVSGALSDVLDGYLARHYKIQTKFGKIIDPIADKIFINVLFFLFYLDGLVPLGFIGVILLRDVLILLGALWLYIKSSGKIDFQPSYLGKLSTCFQLLFLMGYFFHVFVINLPHTVILILYQLVLLLVIVSGFHYLLLFKKFYRTIPTR